ncbi:hypothetical protein P8H27_02120 [Pseudomonas sp. sp1636]|uniref:hypothetical protein n=1 Tax=Pseudomonas sp. sp1636 TaxID=3036707 RepID=UPI0025A5185A|nr:hypothetical protein [Pseudomonas sp. sp1636]MDM8347691.1 hypothetical protein [Pseudomonas sp. sp1636]
MKQPPKPPLFGSVTGKLTEDCDTLGQAEGDPGSELATTKEGEGQRCQVCDFPDIAGHVHGEVEGERYSLMICQGCLQHAVLCLRDSYRQCRLFDDDFEIAELCGFGKVSPALKGEAAEWEQMKPVGREFGADSDDTEMKKGT